MNVVFAKLITENMPEAYGATLSIFVNASIAMGLVPCYLIGAILPDPEDFEANRDDELWRVIYLVPAMIGVLELVLMLFVFTEEPITYCIINGLEEQANRHMKKVYRLKDTLGTKETIEEVLAEQQIL